MRRAVVALLCLITLGCSAEEDGADLVWAVNVAGPAYVSVDGTAFEAEMSVTGGTARVLDTVLGTQDEFIYQTYREGDIQAAYPLANGVYDITFHFAEPHELAAGERIFDAFVEDERAIEDLDVMLERDGNIRSALTVTVPDVVVDDGELNVRLEASKRQPLLSGLVVRSKDRPPKAWELVWSDEFATSGDLDYEKWNVVEWPPRTTNSEDQAYTARRRNVRVEGGNLIIEAHKEDYDDAQYTSARVNSRGMGDFLYGRFEARARLLRGQGTWAAIWMLPSDPYRYATTCEEGEDWHGSRTCDAWPNSGEIDIMEHVGHRQDHIHGTVHNKAHYFINQQQRKGRILVDSVADDWHVYALEWGPDRIDIFVDDTLYFSYINDGAGWQSWPFDAPFHLILNVAVGGDWGRAGGPIDDSMFPQKMVVDWVRVYALDE